jgi:hypothetical protein
VLVSVVVHLVADQLREGRVVGRAEAVATGDAARIHDLDGLVDFLRRQAGPADPAAGGPPVG